MSNPESKMAEPSIDEMLSTIRDAIHEETARESEEHARTFKTSSEPRKHDPEFRRADIPPPPSPPQKPATGVSGSMRELRVSLQPADQTHSRGTVTARSEDFLSLKNKLASLRQSPSKPKSDAGSKPKPDASLAGVMSGDVRLEDALARIDPPRQTQRQRPSAEPRFVAPEPPQAARSVPATNKPTVEPQMRAAINEVAQDQTESDYLSVEQVHVAPKPVAAKPVTPEQVAPEPVAPEAVAVEPAPPEPVAVAANTTSAEPEFVPPPMTADPAILEYTEVESTQAPPAPAQVPPARVIEAPVEAAVPQSAPTEQVKDLQKQEVQPPVKSEATSIMSGDTMLAASSAFDLLSNEIFSKSSGGERILEDSARDMVKPMLKKWLDDNLPTLVERLVREEIERVARKGGR